MSDELRARDLKELTGTEWNVLLSEISKRLGHDTHLCLMGSATNLFEGMPDRTSVDLDVWLRASKINRADLKQAVESVGLLFDPKEDEKPDRPYIQLVEPGIAQVGQFSDQTPLRPTEGRLEVTRPPIANLIAAKMLRMRHKDMEDVGFLLNEHPEVSNDDVRSAIKTFPRVQRETAMENLVYLDLLRGRPAPERALSR